MNQSWTGEFLPTPVAAHQHSSSGACASLALAGRFAMTAPRSLKFGLCQDARLVRRAVDPDMHNLSRPVAVSDAPEPVFALGEIARRHDPSHEAGGQSTVGRDEIDEPEMVPRPPVFGPEKAAADIGLLDVSREPAPG